MRIWSEKGFYAFEIEVLTPAHIGGEEEFTPLEYAVREKENGEFEVILIDTQAWLAVYHTDDIVAKALEEGDMASLRRSLNFSSDLTPFIRGSARVANSALGRALINKRESIESKAEIEPFIRNPYTRRPYIPASSLKGAISTALTDCLNLTRQPGKIRLRDDPRKYKEIMDDIYGKIGEHAMGGVKMGDIELPPGCTSIQEAKGIDLRDAKVKNKNNLKGERTPCEALDPEAFNKYRVFGNIRLALCDGTPAIKFKNGLKITYDKLSAICNKFYRERFEKEYNKFYTRPEFSAAGEAMKDIRERVAKMDLERETLLRIGRYSHIESVTVSGQTKGGESRTLAGGRLPFGWIILKRSALKEYEEGVAVIDGYLREEFEEIRRREEAAKRLYAEREGARQEERERRERKAEEARLAREAREKALREEAEREKARAEALATLSPEEAKLWELSQPGSTENLAIEIYNKLKDYDEAMQLKAAESLRDFWLREKKWSGKELTKKQKEKVKAVREILEKAGRE